MHLKLQIFRIMIRLEYLINKIMKMEKKNQLFFGAIIILIITGLFFILRVTDGNLKFDFKNKNTGVVVKDDGVVKMKNLVNITGGNFDTANLTIKSGEAVTFINQDNVPHKIIGNDWQSAYFEKTGSFSKSDFKQGENIVYIENLPDSKIKIIVK